jgi:chaperone modulatory protein CbpM
MTDRHILTGVVIEDAGFTLEDISCACSVSTEWVVRQVEEGTLACVGSSVAEWRFSTTELVRARRMRAVERDFDAVPELAALVADMLDEIDVLRARLRRTGRG